MYSPVISPRRLLDNLSHPDLLIVDCRFQLDDPGRGYGDYLENHITGSVYLDLDRHLTGPLEKHGGRHPLPSPEKFREVMESIGVIKNRTQIIAYDSSRFAFAARFWWLCRYYGHDKVCLLDGGWQNWLNSGYPVSDSIPVRERGHFIPDNERAGETIDIQTLKASKDRSGVVLIDSREEKRYLGAWEPIDPVAGHIAGAVNYPWTEITDPRGFVLPGDKLQQHWRDCLHADEIIVYCGSGVTACVNILSLLRAGYGNVKLYPGGWSDWCSYLERT